MSNDIETIVKSIKRKETILQLSSRLGKTIAQTSRILGGIAAENDKFRQAFKILRWPVNVDHGHIFVGSRHTTNGSFTHGERNGELKIGDYVLTKSIGNQRFAEIYSAEYVEQFLFKFFTVSINNRKQRIEYDLLNNLLTSYKFRGMKNNDPKIKKLVERMNKIRYAIDDDGKFVNLREISEVWLTAKEYQGGLLKEIGERELTGCKYQYTHDTGESRTVYLPGKWLGTPDRRNLVSVNSTGK